MRVRLIFASTFIAALLAFTAGCNGPQSTLDPAGPAAHEISSLSWIVYGTFCAVGLVMWALILWVALRKRGSLEEHAPVDAGGGEEWIVTGGFAIPFVILAVLFVLSLRTLSAFPVTDGHTADPQIIVTGHQWWWELEYTSPSVDQRFKSANEIHIPVGRPIDIELRSADVIHSFWIPRLHGKEDLIPGQPNLIRIQADQAGTYRGQCAEYCGAQHAHMALIVVAQPEAEYETWRAAQLGDSAPPANPEQTAGQQQFMNKPCELCHTIRGTGAHGNVGPDLTHIGSRQGLAANMLPNNEADLAAWVTHAQALKPAAAMPNVTQFTGAQLNQIVAYLQSLK